VRQVRKHLGITQAELATRIGSTQPAIARLEAGGNTPSFGTLRRIAAALGLRNRGTLVAQGAVTG
jgi:predicted transcriptional regulator